MPCIAGAIAEPYYGGVPATIWSAASERLNAAILSSVEAFRQAFPCPQVNDV